MTKVVSPAPGTLTDVRAERLHHLSRPHAWSLEKDVAWETLAFQQIPAAIRRAMAIIYGGVLEAEVCGHSLTARIVERMPESRLRQFAKVQLGDEARHVAFFERVAAGMGRQEGQEGHSASIAALHRELRDVRDYDELMLHTLVLENAAQILFIGNAKQSLRMMTGTVRIPGSQAIRALVTMVLRLVGQDEARHVAFGMQVLRHGLSGRDASARHALESRVKATCELMQTTISQVVPGYTTLGFESQPMLDRVWAAQRQRLGILGFEIGDGVPIHPPTG